MRAWLHEKGVELEERDFFQDRFGEDELRQLLQGQRLSEVFSWNSPSFKKLGVSREDLDDEALIRLMLGEPRLIRRPLVKIGAKVVVGTDKAAMERALR